MDTVTEMTLEDAESRANSSEALEFTPNEDAPVDTSDEKVEDENIDADIAATDF